MMAPDRKGLLDAFERAREDWQLCPNRVWEIGSSFEGGQSMLPDLLDGLLPNSVSEFKNAVKNGMQRHDMCTFDFCELSTRDYTAVEQRHESEICEKHTCPRLKTGFKDKILSAALKSGRQLTAWTLDGRSMIKHPQPFMAISHVWSDGTGNGIWPKGEVNECLYNFFKGIAEQFWCEGIWWDTICIPKDKEAKTKALNAMQANYEYARVTLVHDGFLRKLTCTDENGFDPKTACFAIIMSPWFSRAWTALELAKSRKVKVIFKDAIKDLDEDILKKVNKDNPAAKTINNLRNPVAGVEGLLAVLGHRQTSWLRDQPKIAGLLTGVEYDAEMPQSKMYQNILLKIGRLHHGHLFHNSATMSGGFSWCATSLLRMPLAHPESTQSTLTIEKSGDVAGEWKVVRIDNNPIHSYVCRSSHPLIEEKLRLALEEKDKHVLLVEPQAKSIERGLLVKPMFTKFLRWWVDGWVPRMKVQYICPLYLHTTLPAVMGPNGTPTHESDDTGQPRKGTISFTEGTADYIIVDLKIGNTEDFEERQTVWDILADESQYNAGWGEADQDEADQYYSSWDEADQDEAGQDEADQDEADQDEADQDEADQDESDQGDDQARVKQLALISATAHGDLERVNKLVNYILGTKLNPNHQDLDGWTALHHAAWTCHEAIIDSLVKVPGLDFYIRDERGQQALHLAAERGNEYIVASLLGNYYWDNPGLKCKQGQTALHRAVWGGSEEIVAKILSEWPKPLLNLQDNEGRTALYYAVERGNQAMVEQLLKKGANPNIKDKKGRTVLHWAVKVGNPKLVNRLIQEGADAKAEDPYHLQTVLHWAAWGGKLELVILIYSRLTAPDIEVKDRQGRTALHLAALGGSIEVVEFFINRGLSIMAKDFNEQTALHWAAKGGSNDVLKFFMKKKDLWFYNWPDLLNSAAKAGQRATVQLLMEKTGQYRHPRDMLHKLAPLLTDSAAEGHRAVAALLLEEVSSLWQKIDIPWENYYDIAFEPLHKAAKEGHTAIVALLIDKGLNCEHNGLHLISNRSDNFGWRPLHLAAWRGHTEIVGLLIEKVGGIDAGIRPPVHSVYASGRPQRPNWRALHLAAHAGYALTVELLVEKGAERREKIAADNGDHKTPLQLAAQERHQAVLEVLIAKDWYDHARLLDVIMDDWNIALSSAAKAGHKCVVGAFFETLVGKWNDDPQKGKFLDKVLYPGLLAAVGVGRKEIIRLFVEMTLQKRMGRKKVDLARLAESLFSALDVADSEVTRKIINVLVKGQLTKLVICDPGIQWAASNGRVAILQLLIEVALVAMDHFKLGKELLRYTDTPSVREKTEVKQVLNDGLSRLNRRVA
jgi:ankyrin repeat protein